MGCVVEEGLFSFFKLKTTSHVILLDPFYSSEGFSLCIFSQFFLSVQQSLQYSPPNINAPYVLILERYSISFLQISQRFLVVIVIIYNDFEVCKLDN